MLLRLGLFRAGLGLGGLVITAPLPAIAGASDSVPAAGVGAPAPGEWVVTAFGAVGDGVTLDTSALQRTIDRAAERGGRVIVPAGTFVTGTLYLRSRVELYLARGAVLAGSQRLADFPENASSLRSYTDNYVCRALLWADGQEDIAVRGDGIIDGRGTREAFPTKINSGYRLRPYLIRFVACRGVEVSGITLRNSPMWVQHYLACRDVRLLNLTVFSHANRNNDGIDIDSCRRVLVSGCLIDSDDDGICLKSTTPEPCEDIVVTGCTVSSHCSALKLGTESTGGFRNIVISNCTVRPSAVPQPRPGRAAGHAGVALETVDGGTLEFVTVSNLSIQQVDTPVFIRLGRRLRPYREGVTPPLPGRLRQVVISNLTAHGVGRACSSITGVPGHPVEGVVLDNIVLLQEGGGSRQDAQRVVPENEEGYPEASMFGPVLPAHALYVRHVRGLSLGRIQVTTLAPDARPAIVWADATEAVAPSTVTVPR